MPIASRPTSLLTGLSAFLQGHPAAVEEFLTWLEQRFQALEPRLASFLPEAGRFDRIAGDLDQLFNRFPEPSSRPVLFGVPIGVKDIYHVQGLPTRAGSALPAAALEGEQASSVAALRRAGAIVLGKTVTTEFAYFAPGATTNPHNPAHTPGGSSSGSAASVAAGLCPLALGTQTIGSINRPAAFCGVIGFKPTYGRISTHGIIPLAPSLDHAGFFAPDVASAALAARQTITDWKAVEPPGKLLRLAVPTGVYLEHAAPAAMQQFEADLACLRAAGHDVLDVPAMADFDEVVERHNLILAAEAARVHESWFATYADSYHPRTAELIRRGAKIADETREKALAGRQALRATLESLMDAHSVDAWITPSAPGPAPEGLESTGDPVMNLPWTHSGMPTITLPVGKDPSGLPLALQVIARAGQDERLLAWASLLESIFSYQHLPGLTGFLEERS